MIQNGTEDRTPQAPANPQSPDSPTTALSEGIPIEVSSAGTGTTNDPSASDGGRPGPPPPAV